MSIWRLEVASSLSDLILRESSFGRWSRYVSFMVESTFRHFKADAVRVAERRGPTLWPLDDMIVILNG